MTAFVLVAVLAGAAQKEQAFQTEVAAARGKAIDFLKKQQNKDGTWEGTVVGLLADMAGGQTALVALALLEAGVPADDEALAKAIAAVANLEPKKTYVVGLQTQVLAAADPKKYKDQIQKNANWLVKTAVPAGAGKIAGWSYPGNTIADGSNTHFAVMGLHAATQAGAKVDRQVWLQVRDMYRNGQLKDGAWAYYDTPQIAGQANMNMTAAALVGLTVSAEYDPNAKTPDPAVQKGMKLVVPWNLESPKSNMYALMVTAELGRALGASELKDGDRAKAWYREGAGKLLKMQRADGAFAAGNKSVDGQPVLATAFGLYFLGPAK